MSDGESDSTSHKPEPKPRRMFKVLLLGLVIAVLAGLAGAAGWLLAVRHEAAVRAEAGGVAELRCQRFVARRLFVVGDVRIMSVDGRQITYRFECRLSAYSPRDRNWGALAGTKLEPKP